MVSPSKQQHQNQQSLPKNTTVQRPSNLRLQRGDKPLEKKKFYLDVKNHVLASKLETRIKDCGGSIELFLDQSVTLVVSDRAAKFKQANSEKRKWGYTSGGSVGPPSLRSVEVPTPTWTPPTPSLNGECPLSNSTNTRGQPAQRTKSRVDAMLERVRTQPQQCSVDPLDNAHNWGIPIWTTDKLQAWLDKIYVTLKDSSTFKSINRTGTEKDFKVKDFKSSYVKFESYQRETRPVFLELSVWPTLNFDGALGSSPFDTKLRGNKEENLKSAKVNKKKEMTRKPRATATRTRRSEQLVAGYCEICRSDYKDLSKHIDSEKHLAFVRNNDNFLSLDTLISAGTNVEAFLKLNQSDDVKQELFVNGNDSLHGVIRSEKDQTVESVDFGVDELKMVQCNGTQRKLNLKLSSPHNLRTRTKHESGHLLRSKGSPWHEVEKNEKFYEKFERYTIKKRAKGTIWIEEDDPPDKCDDDRISDAKIVEKSPLTELNDVRFEKKEANEQTPKKCSPVSRVDDRTTKKKTQVSSVEQRTSESPKEKNHSPDQSAVSIKKTQECEVRLIPEYDDKSPIKEFRANGILKLSSLDTCKSSEQRTKPVDSLKIQENTENPVSTCNGESKEAEKCLEASSQVPEDDNKNEKKDEKSRLGRFNKRVIRSSRARPRLSVEERLIEDNRAYYKVEVLGNKLRSNTAYVSNNASPTKEIEKEVKKEGPSSEKPVVVRFKRVRKSELSLLSDEAEMFMFGDSRRDESSDWNNEKDSSNASSILPKDTESEDDGQEKSSMIISSPKTDNSPLSSPIKEEPTIDEDSQDSTAMGRARKRRRTQAEALIEDNTAYYKFETPGSRLRFQSGPGCTKEPDQPSTKDSPLKEAASAAEKSETEGTIAEEKLYPSKPSAEIEKMHFSFESIPKSEPWYQTYQRQDEGAEFWHYFSESDAGKPFLLPYEIDNFHETLVKLCQKNNEARKKAAKARGPNGLGRSPRKSPRCHASTLAIMSTIIRKREQQQLEHRNSPNLSVVHEESRSGANTPKSDVKSSTDMDIREIAKSIDDMLDVKIPMDDSFEPDPDISAEIVPASEPPGPPINLIELLDNCHQHVNGIENSSCASSECGEVVTESPLKRRKRRKNRTGWPGIKARRKLPSKLPTIPDVDCEQENQLSKAQTTEGEEEEEEEGEEEEEDEEGEENKRNKQSICERLQVSVVESSTGSQEGKLTKCKSTSNSSECQTASESEKTYGESVGRKRHEANDENHENVFRQDARTTSARQQLNLKSVTRRRQRDTDARASSSVAALDSHKEIENHDNLYRQKSGSGIILRKNYSTGPMSRKRLRDSSGGEIEAESSAGGDSSCKKKDNVSPKKTVKNKKLPRKGTESSFDNENCRKDQLEPDAECERVSPPSEIQQRRSSIEFQPVVRVMKIEDQVDMDQSILSVTVASNRRLRSSSSPKLTVSPPAKRYKRAKGPLGRWIKNS